LCLEGKTDQERFEELGWRLGLHEHPESFRVGTHIIEYIGISTTSDIWKFGLSLFAKMPKKVIETTGYV